jgi:hypothetical protein
LKFIERPEYPRAASIAIGKRDTHWTTGVAGNTQIFEILLLISGNI